MKTSLLFLTNLFFLFIFSSSANSADIYAEYQITGTNSTPMISKMYGKNGNVRTETIMNVGGRPMNTTTLILKSNPNVAYVYNSLTTTYTEAKINSKASIKDISIKVLGNEKVGNYNCTHVKMTSDGKTWDAWFTKELPSFNFPISGNNELGSQKVMNELKSKGITGMMAKAVFLTPGGKSKAFTMQLVKYETKTLNASLFTLPSGYKKSSVTLDPEKMKNMTREQKKELMMKMIKEQQLKH
ncbi:DUF4412 domain-containing protein [Pedobacter frigiditerrae]|uniref:DUF4412 domain-containing protein n=1 Tax=Pedobacter frigiditerrae TaxID=2530452 RepID=A0A4R0N6K6_9SPHI|nr:DUF4412 domain-containing protein [Pedobacter frigiditerrae]TCC94282.1 DUF4412 domain-containing protein [Pedobacter frigiditerrae]